MAKAQVHALKQRDDYYYRIDSAGAILQHVRLRMYDWSASDLAATCGISTSCVYRIRGGRTKWPRQATFFTLLRVLDLELYVRFTR